MGTVLGAEEIQQRYPLSRRPGAGKPPSPEVQEVLALSVGRGVVWDPCPRQHRAHGRGDYCSLAPACYATSRNHGMKVRTYHASGALVVVRVE